MVTIMLSLGDFLLRSRQTPYPVFFLKAAPGLKSFLGVLFICCSLSSCALTPFKDNSIHGGKEEVAIINTGEETNPAVSPLPEDDHGYVFHLHHALLHVSLHHVHGCDKSTMGMRRQQYCMCVT